MEKASPRSKIVSRKERKTVEWKGKWNVKNAYEIEVDGGFSAEEVRSESINCKSKKIKEKESSETRIVDRKEDIRVEQGEWWFVGGKFVGKVRERWRVLEKYG